MYKYLLFFIFTACKTQDCKAPEKCTQERSSRDMYYMKDYCANLCYAKPVGSESYIVIPCSNVDHMFKSEQ